MGKQGRWSSCLPSAPCSVLLFVNCPFGKGSRLRLQGTRVTSRGAARFCLQICAVCFSLYVWCGFIQSLLSPCIRFLDWTCRGKKKKKNMGKRWIHTVSETSLQWERWWGLCHITITGCDPCCFASAAAPLPKAEHGKAGRSGRVGAFGSESQHNLGTGTLWGYGT